MSTGTDVTGSRTVWAVAVVGLVLLGGTATVATAAPAHVTVSAMDVSDDEPETGDTITVTPTVRHSSSGSGSFEVTEVTLEDASGTRYAEASDPGTLGPGDTIDVPLRTTVQSAGEKTFVVHVRGVRYDSEGRWDRITHTEYPAHVTVSEPSTETETTPQLNVEAERPIAGTESTVDVTVSNGGDEEISDLSLRLSGLDGMENRTKLRPALGATNSTTFRFDVRPPEAGTSTLTATLEYGDGDVVETSEAVDVAPMQADASVYATVSEQNDTLQYRVTNHGNVPLENVVVSGAAVGTPLPATVIPTVDPGTSETATVELNDRPSGPATVSATYGVGSTTGETDRAVQFAGSSPTETTDALSDDDAATATSERREPVTSLGPLSLLVGGAVATGSILSYRSWRGRGP
jgi:hypothetical protein